MKRKVLTGINALIALLLGILGLNGGCLLKYGPAIVAEYGVPHAMFEGTKYYPLAEQCVRSRRAHAERE